MQDSDVWGFSVDCFTAMIKLQLHVLLTHPWPCVNLHNGKTCAACPTTRILPSILSGFVMQAIHSVGWHHEGKQFMCSHSDGSLTMWNLRNTTKPIQITFPHGEEQKPLQSIAATGGAGCAVWPHDLGSQADKQGLPTRICIYDYSGWCIKGCKANGNEGLNKSRVPVLNVAGGSIIISEADLLRLLPWWLEAAVRGGRLISCVWMSHL